jgi:hypothetical protein
MTVRRHSETSLALAVRASRSAVHNYRAGHNLPTLAVAVRLADELEWGALLEIVAGSRRGRCAFCGRPWTNNGQGPKRFCSVNCRLAARQGRDRDHTPRETYQRALDLHQAAVADFCASCEPGGVCKDAGCELRPVSPLPLRISGV